MRNDYIIAIFFLAISPLVSCPFVKNERLECEIKVSLGYCSAFIDIIRRNYNKSYDIQSFSYPYVGVIFDKSF